MMIPQVSGYPDYDVFMTEQVPGPRRSKIVGRHMWTVPYSHNSHNNPSIKVKIIQKCDESWTWVVFPLKVMFHQLSLPSV